MTACSRRRRRRRSSGAGPCGAPAMAATTRPRELRALGSSNVAAATYGFAAGMDYHYSPDTIFGFALGGAGTNWGLAERHGHRPQRCVPDRRLRDHPFGAGLRGGRARLCQSLVHHQPLGAWGFSDGELRRPELWGRGSKAAIVLRWCRCCCRRRLESRRMRRCRRKTSTRRLTARAISPAAALGCRMRR